MGHVADRPARWRGGSDADRPTDRPAGEATGVLDPPIPPHGPAFGTGLRPVRLLRRQLRLRQVARFSSGVPCRWDANRWNAVSVEILTSGTLLPWSFLQMGRCSSRGANRWEAVVSGTIGRCSAPLRFAINRWDAAPSGCLTNGTLLPSG